MDAEIVGMTAKMLIEANVGLTVQVPGRPDYYVTDTGLVLSYAQGRPRWIRGCRCGIGYRAITFGLGGPRRYIHHLVAESFLGPRPPGLEIRHLDGNLDNNDFRNLAWGTAAENAADKVRHGRSLTGEKNHRARLTWARVAAMRERLKVVRQIDVCREFGVSPMTVSRLARGLAWRIA